MQIILVQAEIETAIRNYVNSKVKVNEGQDIRIDLSASRGPEGFRANIDNYVYNGMGMSTGAWETVSYNNSQLNNLNASFLKTGFKTRQYLSDYYVENASFLKLDNLSLSYNVGKINKWVEGTGSSRAPAAVTPIETIC